MISEDYINFDIAKLLKEKGFDENCSRSYVKDKLAVSQGFNNSYYTTMYSDVSYRPISAPTIQMAMKYLREVHHIFIRVIQSHIEYCACEIYYNRGRFYEFRESFNSYEQACESAIKYCLENLI